MGWSCFYDTGSWGNGKYRFAFRIRFPVSLQQLLYTGLVMSSITWGVWFRLGFRDILVDIRWYVTYCNWYLLWLCCFWCNCDCNLIFILQEICFKLIFLFGYISKSSFPLIKSCGPFAIFLGYPRICGNGNLLCLPWDIGRLGINWAMQRRSLCPTVSLVTSNATHTHSHRLIASRYVMFQQVVRPM